MEVYQYQYIKSTSRITFRPAWPHQVYDKKPGQCESRVSAAALDTELYSCSQLPRLVCCRSTLYTLTLCFCAPFLLLLLVLTATLAGGSCLPLGIWRSAVLRRCGVQPSAVLCRCPPVRVIPKFPRYVHMIASCQTHQICKTVKLYVKPSLSLYLHYK